MIRLKIADIIMQLNLPLKLLHDNMYDFLYKGADEADIVWNFVFDNPYTIDEKPNIITDNYNFYYENNKVVYNYKSRANIPLMIVCNTDYDECIFYLPKNLENLDKCSSLAITQAKNSLFKAFKEIFILGCIYKNRLPIHSSTVIYEDKGYMFSSALSSGKSTHAELWSDVYGCDILNEDMAIIGLAENEDKKEVVVYGVPWCGTSNIYRNEHVLLGGIAFIKKGKENIIFDLGIEELGLNLFENHYVPLLTKGIADVCVKNICTLGRCCKGYTLTCNKDKEAAVKAFDYMV